MRERHDIRHEVQYQHSQNTVTCTQPNMINHHLVYTPESVVAAAGQVDCMADDDADIDCTTSSSETMQTERTSRTFIYPSSYNIAMKTLMALLALILLQLTEALISSCAIIIDGFYSTFTYFFYFCQVVRQVLRP